MAREAKVPLKDVYGFLCTYRMAMDAKILGMHKYV